MPEGFDELTRLAGEYKCLDGENTFHREFVGFKLNPEWKEKASDGGGQNEEPASHQIVEELGICDHCGLHKDKHNIVGGMLRGSTSTQLTWSLS